VKDKHIIFRVDADMLARIDAQAAALSTPWHKATRTEALRLIVATGLDTIEAQAKIAPRKPRK